MTKSQSLADAFKKTKYQGVGHGPRTLHVLQDALANSDRTLSSDIYGTGEIIERFQDKMAQFLGKERAVFFPSGTMAQQIALRIWCDEKCVHKVAYHPLCHLEIHEERGLQTLHNIESVLLGEKKRLIEREDFQKLSEPVSTILIELPQREIGGQLPDFETLVWMSNYCKENGIKFHLDGARLFESLPYYQKSAAEICALFDSIYVSFYKGVGGIAGAILAGEATFIEHSVVWKRRHGGDLISLYPYILSADYYFDKRIPKMASYYTGAQELAALWNQCRGVHTEPLQPVTNMFHVHFSLPQMALEDLLITLYESTDVGWTASLKATDAGCSFELSIGEQYEVIPKSVLAKAFAELSQRITAVLQ